jgi:hypothetical protein
MKWAVTRLIPLGLYNPVTWWWLGRYETESCFFFLLNPVRLHSSSNHLPTGIGIRLHLSTPPPPVINSRRPRRSFFFFFCCSSIDLFRQVSRVFHLSCPFPFGNRLQFRRRFVRFFFCGTVFLLYRFASSADRFVPFFLLLPCLFFSRFVRVFRIWMWLVIPRDCWFISI